MDTDFTGCGRMAIFPCETDHLQNRVGRTVLSVWAAPLRFSVLKIVLPSLLCRTGVYDPDLQRSTSLSLPCGEVKRVVSRAQIFSVHERHAYTEYAQLGLRASVPLPISGAEISGGTLDFASVEERADFQTKQAVSVDVFVERAVDQEVVCAERRAAFAAIARADMATQPQMVVTLHAEFEQFVERWLPSCAATANIDCRFVVVALHLGEPVCLGCPFQFGEGVRGL